MFIAKLAWFFLPALAGGVGLSACTLLRAGNSESEPPVSKSLASGGGLASTLNLQGLSREEQLFVLVDATAKEITGRPNPGFKKLKPPYDKPILFGMEGPDAELNYNRLRLYVFTKAAGIDLRFGGAESKESLAARIKGFTERAIQEVEERFGFKATQHAKWNVQGGVNAIVASKFPYKENSYSIVDPSGRDQSFVVGVEHGLNLLDLCLKSNAPYVMACGEYASVTSGLHTLTIPWVDISASLSRGETVKELYKRSPATYSNPSLGQGDVRKLAPNEVLGGHAWSEQGIIFNPAKNPGGFPDWVGKDGFIRIPRDPIFLNEHFGIGGDTVRDPVKALDKVVERMVHLDPNNPELRIMYGAIRVTGNTKSTPALEPDFYQADYQTEILKDYRGLKSSFDFYGELIDGKRDNFGEVD